MEEQTSAPDLQPSSSSSAAKRKAAEWWEIPEERNTYVYVSGLPRSLTEDDFLELMKKYGIIAKKPLMGQPFNIKLYKDADGSFKGDALCCYARPESVELALTHLDGYWYDDKHELHCEKAKFQMKGEAYDPSKRPRLDKRAKLKQKKSIKNMLSWEPSDTGAGQKRVILKNMFRPEEILEDATLILDLQEDVESKCLDIKCEAKKITVFDKHPDGVISVTFPDSSQAKKCVESLHDMWYAERKVKAELWDGKTKYKTKEGDETTEPAGEEPGSRPD